MKKHILRKLSIVIQQTSPIFLIILMLSSFMLSSFPCLTWALPNQASPKSQTSEPVVVDMAQNSAPVEISLRQEAQHSLDLAIKWLINKQNPDGSWSDPDYPALTGLILLGFLRDPSAHLTYTQYPPFIKKALSFILSKVQPDGSIYTPAKGLSTYNTSICLTALVATGNPEYQAIIQKARNYLISLQKDEGKPGATDQAYDGGIGYGGKEKHSDLSNMYLALEALYVSKGLEYDRQEKSLADQQQQVETKELNWQAALRFIERCQNNPQYNDQTWASNDPNNFGGFIYFPGSSKADEEKLPNGKTALRSYGSMTYAGLLSFINGLMS